MLKQGVLLHANIGGSRGVAESLSADRLLPWRDLDVYQSETGDMVYTWFLSSFSAFKRLSSCHGIVSHYLFTSRESLSGTVERSSKGKRTIMGALVLGRRCNNRPTDSKGPNH
jgi:hypothetical protein